MRLHQIDNRQSQIGNVMTPERWQQVEDVLQAALDRPPRERSAFLTEACLDDKELAREAGSLLDAYEEAADFLEEPAISHDAAAIINSADHNQIRHEIGPYKIIDRIASGGMGEIYLARDPRLNRLVALKLLPAYFVSDDARVRRFQTEARAASALNHTNILTIYEVGECDDNFFIATEYIDGSTIRERIRAGDLSLGEVLEIAGQLLGGLTAAHAAAIIHRDIKPENVMQRNDGVVKILDFGIAKLLEQLPSEASSASEMRTETEVGLMLGTIGYMSPEQVRGLPVDERTDVWSSGVVLFEMLTGRRPFNGKTSVDTIVAMLEREPEPLFGVFRPTDSVLVHLQRVVTRALRKDPRERYQSAAEMRNDLQQIKRELETSEGAITLETSVNEIPGIAEFGARTRMRPELLMLIVAALLVAIFAGTALYQKFVSGRGSEAASSHAATKPYLQMNESEQMAFVAAQEQRISAMMGDRPVKLNDEALRAIKANVDRYVRRQNSASVKPGEEPLRDVYARAPEHIAVIARAFAERKIPIVVGIYLPMIESEYRPCFENQAGAKGLFQFLPSTAEHYGVARAQMCDVQKVAPAAAHYIADRMAELGDDAQSMTLVLLSYNRGTDAVVDSLRRLRETDANYERNFWTLLANRDKLDETFQKESAYYVPAFFAAAIIGENPDAFDLQMPALSSFASPVPETR